MIRYARPSDYVAGVLAAAAGPGALYAMERLSPTYVGKGGLAKGLRVAGFIGLAGGFLYFYQRSARTSLVLLHFRWPPGLCLWKLDGH